MQKFFDLLNGNILILKEYNEYFILILEYNYFSFFFFNIFTFSVTFLR